MFSLEELMSISYVGPMSIFYLGPMSISYVGPMSISYVGPMSISYVGPLSYSYHPSSTLPRTVTSAPSSSKTWSAPVATPKPSTDTSTITSPRIASKHPTIVSSPTLSGSPTTATATTTDVNACIPEDVNESSFIDIELSWDVDTVSPSADFKDELSHGILIAVAEHFSICLPSSILHQGKPLTRQLHTEEPRDITSVNVTSTIIATGESCDAEIHGATCHVAHVTLRVYSDNSEAIQRNSIMVFDFLRSLIDTDTFLATSVEIMDIREHQNKNPAGVQPLASENVRSGPPDNGNSSGGSKTVVIAVLSVLAVSAMIAITAAIRHRFARTSPELVALGDFPSSSSGDLYSTADPTLV